MTPLNQAQLDEAFAFVLRLETVLASVPAQMSGLFFGVADAAWDANLTFSQAKVHAAAWAREEGHSVLYVQS